jgi:hypothetical protein
MALPLSLKSFFAQLSFEPFFGMRLLQPPVFIFKLFHALNHGGTHAAEFGSPLIKLALLMPCSRHSSGTGTPFSACFKIAVIWLSEKRDFFMQNLPVLSLRKIQLLITALDRGDYQPT